MCASNVQNEPPYDIPEPQPPRVYRLAGDAPEEPRGSVALAVLGEMLSTLEALTNVESMLFSDPAREALHKAQIETLRAARDRIAAAEAAL
jgi:hypothetical protein